jgi:hypothetical protein
MKERVEEAEWSLLQFITATIEEKGENKAIVSSIRHNPLILENVF